MVLMRPFGWGDVRNSIDIEKHEFSPEDVKQLLFKVVMPQGNTIKVTTDKRGARRMAAAACGNVIEIESNIVIGDIPEPCRWCEEDTDFW